MPPERPQIVDEEYMSQAMVQISFRLPLRLRMKLDAYLQAMDRPATQRSEESQDWPKTLQATINRGLEDFLASHVPKNRSGPDMKPARPAIKAKKKERQEEEQIGQEVEGV
jgi:hypothetical protein